MKMASAKPQPQNHPSAQVRTALNQVAPKLTLVTNGVLAPHLVTKAKRGTELKARIAEDTKELDGLKTEFEEIFVANATRELTDAKGNVLVRFNHAEPNRLDQKALRAAHPKIVREFTWPHPYDSVGFGS